MGAHPVNKAPLDAPPSIAGGGAPLYDVVVVGGGASGLAAAITAARNGCSVAVIEHDVAAALGILATGNGRCNISNSRLDARRYRHPDAVRRVFGGHPERDVDTFLASLGIVTVEEGEGRLYPITRRAESARDALLGACEREGVDIIACAELASVDADPSGRHQLRVSIPLAPLPRKRGRDAKSEVRNARKALATAARGECAIAAKTVVVACGGASEACCRAFGLPHVPERPVLCPIACGIELPLENALDRLDGLRVEGMLTLMRSGAAIAFEQGEVLFRPYGISGIAAFNLSRRVEVDDVIELDLFPDLNDVDLERMLRGRAEAVGPYTGDPRWFDGLLARPLATIAAESASRAEWPLESMASHLHRLRLRVSGTAEHAQAQVRRGGIPLDAIDLDTLAVLSGCTQTPAPTFACGEALDVDADCGGYNLAWAWLTGVRAGEEAARACHATDRDPHEDNHA